MLLPLSRVDSESSRRALTLAADDISRVALFERVPIGFTVVGSFCVLALHAAPPLAALVLHAAVLCPSATHVLLRPCVWQGLGRSASVG